MRVAILKTLKNKYNNPLVLSIYNLKDFLAICVHIFWGYYTHRQFNKKKKNGIHTYKTR